MQKLLWHRLYAATGILYALIGVLPLGLLPPPPAVASPVNEVTNYYLTYGQKFSIINYLGIVAVALFLCFLVCLRSALARSEQTTHFSLIPFAAGCAWSVIVLIFSGIIQSFPALAANPSTHPILHVLSDLTDTGFTVNVVPAAVLVASASLIILRSPILPRWLSLLGLVVVAIQFVASLGLLISSGPLAAGGAVYDLAFVAFVVWILLTSLVLVTNVPLQEG